MNARERVGVGSVGESPASVPAADKARGRRLEVPPFGVQNLKLARFAKVR
jgi:hypothetical protein